LGDSPCDAFVVAVWIGFLLIFLRFTGWLAGRYDIAGWVRCGGSVKRRRVD
jgi:hypothetical protein